MSSSAPVTVVDYGIGNLLSVVRALDAIGVDAEVSGVPRRVAHAERLIVPGVGAFADCMAALDAHRLVEPVLEFVRSERPMLGICVGMQMLLEVSEEFGETRGLGLIAGRVRPIPAVGADGVAHKIPHIGWNQLQLPAGRDPRWWTGTPLRDVSPGTAVYFVHSFTAEPDDQAHYLAVCDYNGCKITAAVRSGAVAGTQFHPEKSGPAGLAIMVGFLDVGRLARTAAGS